MQLHVRLGGVFDGSRAMELLHVLDRCGTGGVIVDFSGIRRFEPFGVEVLVRGLGALHTGGARIQCLGLPPCVADRLREQEIVVAEFSGRPRWAPWAP